MKKSFFLKVSFLVFFGFVWQYAKCQEIPKSIINGCSPATLSRLYEVVSITNTPSEKQGMLVKFFNNKDSIISKALKAGASRGVIDSILIQYKEEFENIIGRQEKIKYDFATYKEYLERDASVLAKYLTTKYNAKTDIEKAFYNIILTKNNGMAKVYSVKDKMADPLIIGKFLLDYYDSTYQAYITAAKGEAFLDKQLNILSAIKPLSDKEKSIIRSNYIHLCVTKGNDYYMNFRNALPFALKDTIYFKALYLDSLDNDAVVAANHELKVISYKYGVPDSLLKVVYPLVLEKVKKQKTLETTLPYNRLRDSLLFENEELNWAEVKMKMIRFGCYRFSNSKFVNAMKYSQLLKLSTTQMDSLAYYDCQLSKLAFRFNQKYPWTKFDPNPYTNRIMPNVFTEGQYDTLLLIEAKPIASYSAQSDFEALKKYKLLDNTDTAAVLNDLTLFYLKKAMAETRYAADIITMGKILRNIYASKPPALKRLEAYIKMQQAGITDKALE